MNDAILIGVGTAFADDPLLTCRLPGMAARSPVRVVLDTSLRLPLTSALVRSAAETPLWVVAGLAADAGAEAQMRAQGVEVIRCEAGARGIDIASGLRHLARRGITRVLVEGGPRIAAAVLAADMVDEAALFTNSRLIGADGIDALEGLPLATLTASPQLRSLGLDSLGEDTLEMFERVDPCSPASSPISAR
jgi:diaminohydroxyphosphoribosylaminopyrimidine deaminase / 5-amino-6-(5-phosphoribosylamino)uracil reductase